MPPSSDRADRPADGLLLEQARWLAPARARLLRRAQVARRRLILDLGCGAGAVTEELERRGGGSVVALDRTVGDLAGLRAETARVRAVAGDAEALPLRSERFDLVFAQCVFLWVSAAIAVSECARVLETGGVLVAIEPDYEAMIEHPPQIAIRDVWLAALERAGADPRVARKLPAAFAAAGLQVHVALLDELAPASARRFEWVRGLGLTDAERERVERCERAQAECGERAVAHLPFFMLTGTRP